MGSVNHTVVAARHSKFHVRDESEISQAAKLLVDRHGDEADTVAARRADALFREGNATEGVLWLQIFRKVAMSYLSPAP
jgi:hypothetical protein